MSINWTDVISNAIGLVATIDGDDGSALGNINTGLQAAAVTASAAAASASAADEPNPLLSVTAVLSGALAYESAKEVFQNDYSTGKFSGANGPELFLADSLTLVGDFLVMFGGAATLAGPDAEAISLSMNGIADFTTVAGASAQFAYSHNGAIPTISVDTLNQSISVLESSVSEIVTSLSNADSSLSGNWSSAQTALFGLLNSISAAANTTDPTTYDTNVAAAIDAFPSLQLAISDLYNAIVSGNAALSSTTTDQQNAATGVLVGAYQQSGLYVVQSGDTWDSIASTLTGLGTSIDSGTLQRINAVFGITSASTGTILHVPASSPLTGPSFEALPSAIGFTKVFDISNDALYTVGSGANTDLKGALVIDQADFTGHYPTFDAGTYSSVTLNPNGTVNVDLVSGDPVSLGTLTLASSGSGSLTLNNGVTLSLSGLSGTVTGAPSTDTPEQALIAYLGDLGDSTTASALDTTNIDHLNPTGTTYTVTGSISGSDDTFTLEGATPGASVTGSGGYTNILDVSGDIAQDSISDIQQVHIESALTLNASEWTEFSGDGAFSGFDNALTFASSGTFSISGISAGITSMTAEDWGGTTLTGNGTNGQTLTASLFGNDTLTAGSGTGDTLVAGEGVDTLNGGSGGDRFEAYNGLAAGSSVTGSGSGNVLMVGAGGDIGGATITDVPTLEFSSTSFGAVTLSAAELTEFTSFVGVSGSGTAALSDLAVTAQGAGTYSMADFSGSLTADSTDNTTLTGNNNGYDSLIADNTSGTDSLTVSDTSGSTGYNTLSAQNSTGNDTLTASAGSDDTLNVNGSFGNDTLSAGNGNSDSLEALNSAGNNTLTLGNGNNDVLDIDGSSGDNTLTLGNGTGDYLLAENSSGDNTFNVGTTGGTVNLSGSTGENTVNLSGDGYVIAGAGMTIVNGSATGDTRISVTEGLAAGSEITLHGVNSDLYIDSASDDISNATLTGIDYVQIDTPGAVLTLNAAEFAEFTTGFTSGSSHIDVEYGATFVADGAGTYSTLGAAIVEGSSGYNLVAAAAASGVTLEGDGEISIADTSGNDALVSGSEGGDILNASGSTGADTLTSESPYSVTFYAGEGADTLTGGSGNDTFIFTSAAGAGTTVTGGGGSDEIEAETNDISRASVSSVTELVDDSSTLTLTGAEFNGFTTFVNGYGSGATLVVVGSGTYSMSGKTVSGSAFTLVTDSGSTVTGNNSNGQVLYAAATGTSTVDAGTGTGDVLYAEAGTDTLNAGSGGDTLYDGTGTATLNGGSGADTFYVSNPMGGTTVNAGTGDTVYVSGNTGSGAVTDTINMSGGTLYVGAGADADIYGSNNTIITSNNSAVGSHNGGDNTVSEGDSSGVWLLDDGGDTVDAGTGDYIFVSGNGTGDEDNVVNISGGSVDIQTNTQTDVFGSNNSITVGANDLAGAHSGDDNTVTIADNVAFWLSDSGGSSVTGGTGDYVSVSGNGTNGDDNIVNTSDSDIAIDNDTQADVVGAGNSISVGTDSVSGVNGNDNTISLGSGTYYWVNGGTGNTVTASSYNTVTVGGGLGVTLDGGGNDSYEFGSTFAPSTIDNNASGGLTAANGVLGFGSGISDESLWFKESGNNLLIDLLGTTDQITVDNWFGSNAGAQLSEIQAGGLEIDSQFASLVSAMATYSAAHTSFNPQTATSMPTDTTLQSAIAASWHS